MICILLLAVFSYTSALPNGAPESACRSMTPKHGGDQGTVLAQGSEPPYKISASPNSLGMLVTIETPEGPFEGFMLQARSPQGDIVGTFDPIANFARTMNCNGNAGNSLTHTSANVKNDLKVQWHPNDYSGPVTFK